MARGPPRRLQLRQLRSNGSPAGRVRRGRAERHHRRKPEERTIARAGRVRPAPPADGGRKNTGRRRPPGPPPPGGAAGESETAAHAWPPDSGRGSRERGPRYADLAAADDRAHDPEIPAADGAARDAHVVALEDAAGDLQPARRHDV